MSEEEEEASWKTWVTLADIVVLFIGLCVGKYPSEAVVLFAMVFLWITGILSTKEALQGFSSAGLVTIAALFVVIGAASKSDTLTRITHLILGSPSNPRLALFRQMLMVSLLSGFLNNTPLVAFFIPVLQNWTKHHGLNAQKFLIPLSYAAVMGGLCTLVGSSTNLLTQSFLQDDGLTTLSFFEIGYVGYPASIIGMLFIVLVGYRLLPDRNLETARILSDEDVEDTDTTPRVLTEIRISPNCELIGKPILLKIDDLNLNKGKILSLIRLELETLPQSRSPEDHDHLEKSTSSNGPRLDDPLVPRRRMSIQKDPEPSDNENRTIDLDGYSEKKLSSPSKYQSVDGSFQNHTGIEKGTKFCASDRIALLIPNTNIIETKLPVGFNFGCLTSELHYKHEVYFEIVISHSNRFLEKRVTDKEMANFYDFSVVSVRKMNGVNFSNDSVLPNWLDNFMLSPGDAITILAQQDFQQKWVSKSDFYTITRLGPLLKPPSRQERIQEMGCIVILLAMFATGGSGLIPMEQAAVTAAALTVFLGLTDFQSAVNSIEWRLVVMIGSALALGEAMETSALSTQISWILKEVSDNPRTCLFVFMGLELLCTELVSNNAAAAIFYPIAISLSKRLGVNYRPFVIATLFASSSGFSLPIGYQTHLMVLGPGNYKQTDFFKVGVPMDCLYLLTGWTLIPLIFPFN